MSTCEVDKADIIKACNIDIKRTKIMRRNAWLKAIDGKMNRRFFPYKTVKSAAKVVMEDTWTSTWRIGGWRTKGTALRLLSASDVCICDSMTLDVDDAVFVNEWLN